MGRTIPDRSQIFEDRVSRSQSRTARCEPILFFSANKVLNAAIDRWRRPHRGFLRNHFHRAPLPLLEPPWADAEPALEKLRLSSVSCCHPSTTKKTSKSPGPILQRAPYWLNGSSRPSGPSEIRSGPGHYSALQSGCLTCYWQNNLRLSIFLQFSAYPVALYHRKPLGRLCST